jgi:hypothetical protein
VLLLLLLLLLFQSLELQNTLLPGAAAEAPVSLRLLQLLLFLLLLLVCIMPGALHKAAAISTADHPALMPLLAPLPSS